MFLLEKIQVRIGEPMSAEKVALWRVAWLRRRFGRTRLSDKSRWNGDYFPTQQQQEHADSRSISSLSLSLTDSIIIFLNIFL